MALMSARPLTRRSFLAASAGAIAGGVLRPAGALGLLAGRPGPVLWERRLGELPAKGETIELGRSADLVGVEWRGDGAAPRLRFLSRDGAWGPWASAGAHGHGPDAPPEAGRLIGDPLWAGGTTAVQIRAGRPLSGVRLHLVGGSGGVGA